MKRIVIILLLIVWLSKSFGQFTNNQSVGNQSAQSTLFTSWGGIYGSVGLILSKYFDTTAANQNLFIKNYSLAVIGTNDNKVWLRSVDKTKWIDITGGGGGGNTNSNIGSGYRIAVPNTNNLKTLFPGYGMFIDSSSNSNALTFKVDTSTLGGVRWAQNGLYKDGTVVKMGGNWTENTTIGNAGHDFTAVADNLTVAGATVSSAATTSNQMVVGGSGSGVTMDASDVKVSFGSSGSNLDLTANTVTLGSFLNLNHSAGVSGYMKFTTNSTERLRILSNGAWSVGSTGTATGTAGQYLGSNGSSAVPTWQDITSPTTVAWALAGNTITAGTNIIGTLNNARMNFYTNNVNTMSLDSLGGRLFLKNGVDPLLSLKQSTSSQEYQIRTGVGTGLSSQGFSIYDATHSKIMQYGTDTQMGFGNITSIPSVTQLYLKGGTGSRGATFDARADSTGADFSTIEAEHSEYDGSFHNGYGVAIEVFGNKGAPTTHSMGYINKNLSQLRLTNDTNLINVINNAPLIFGTNNTPRAIITGGGNVGIGTSTPTTPLHVVGTPRFVTTNEGVNKFLVSDANGVGDWSSLNGYAWGLTGNAGTTAGTNFIGTTDDVNLMFKINNVQSGLIDDANLNTSLGYSTLAANTTGFNNSAFGYGALAANTTGYNNTVVGHSLYNNISGHENVAIGNTAMANSITGSQNIGIGDASLATASSTTGNIGIGRDALHNTKGSYNTGIGYQSLYTDSADSRNIGLGAYSGFYNKLDSQRLFINSIDRTNYAGDTTKSIIYGVQNATAANQRLRINANTGINGPASTYALDVTGSANISGAGVIGGTLTVPLTNGGTGTTSTYTIQPTSGSGTTGADILFNVGNNGGTPLMRMFTNSTAANSSIAIGTSLNNANGTIGERTALLEIVNKSNSSVYPLAFKTYGDATVSPSTEHYRAGGTESSPSATLNGYLVESIGYRVYDTAMTQSIVADQVIVDGNTTVTNWGGYKHIEATPNGSKTRVGVMDFKGTGAVSLLTLFANSNIQLQSDGTSGIAFTGANGTVDDMTLYYDRPSTFFAIRDNNAGANRLTVTQTGTVTMPGTVNTGAILSTTNIGEATSSSSGFYFADGSSVGQFNMYYDRSANKMHFRDMPNSADRFTFTQTGNFGIGTTSPDSNLTVNLGTNLKRGVRFSANAAGTWTLDANGVGSSVSDIRLKDVQRMYNGGLSEVMQINPIVYKWKKKSGLDTKNNYIGFSAQNIKDVLGEGSYGINKEGYLSIQDRSILAVLTNAVKQQQKEIDELKKEIKRLKK